MTTIVSGDVALASFAMFRASLAKEVKLIDIPITSVQILLLYFLFRYHLYLF